MEEKLYPKKKDANRVSLILLSVIALNQLGLFSIVGLNLAAIKIPFLGIPVLGLLLSAGVAWIAYGLYRGRIGG